MKTSKTKKPQTNPQTRIFCQPVGISGNNYEKTVFSKLLFFDPAF